METVSGWRQDLKIILLDMAPACNSDLKNTQISIFRAPRDLPFIFRALRTFFSHLRALRVRGLPFNCKVLRTEDPQTMGQPCGRWLYTLAREIR